MPTYIQLFHCPLQECSPSLCLHKSYDRLINARPLLSWVWLILCDDGNTQAPAKVSDWYRRQILYNYWLKCGWLAQKGLSLVWHSNCPVRRQMKGIEKMLMERMKWRRLSSFNLKKKLLWEPYHPCFHYYYLLNWIIRDHSMHNIWIHWKLIIGYYSNLLFNALNPGYTFY